VPIVYLTAHSEEETLQRAKVTEPYGYILKPFEERALLVTVEMALYKAGMQGELQRAKDRLETVLRCIDEGVVVAAVNGEVEYVNPVARGLLLGGRDAGRGTMLSEILKVLDPETMLPTALPVNRVIMDGENVQLHALILQTADQRRFPADFSFAPLKDENDNTRGMVVAFRDVTERRRMQEIVNRELSEALFLQKSVLPHEDIRVGGIRARWLFHAASLAAGDLFGVIPIDAERAAVYMFDVAGHGISAAVSSLLLRRFLTLDADGKRMQFLDADVLSPLAVVEALRARFTFGAGVPFFSMLYGTVDAKSGLFTFVRAGAPNPILQEAGGTVQPLLVEGQAVGGTAEKVLVEHTTPLGAGERVFLYSDAVLECTNPAMEPFTHARLSRAIEATRRFELPQAVAGIDAQILEWRSSEEFDDDVCLLAFQLG
jgi:serine phosphatase RsbU (regulator of sigma subunit)